MNPAWPVLLLAGSGMAALALQRRPVAALWVAAAGSVAGASAAFRLAGACLLDSRCSREIVVAQSPFGPLALGVDPLAAAFLVPMALLLAAGGIYAVGYVERRGGATTGALFNLLGASMVLVVLAQHAVLLLVAWEVMTLSSFLLVTRDHREPDVRRAGWTYLIAGHVSVSALLLLFLLLEKHAGTLEFPAGPLALDTAPATALFLLAVLGFGVKAGFVPLHVWLPEAHAAAPSHVSALLSGAMVKLGLYGILRVLGFLPMHPGFGVLLAIVGASGALFGITLALRQQDLKRALAYSTIENVGLIALGVGIALWAAPFQPVVATFALLGALLHVWNHAAMKGLLFLSAGSVLHATGTRNLERLGGLARAMPFTATCLTVGAVAIAGLPPLNGFAGEWLLYLGFATSGIRADTRTSVAATLALGLVALVGALAVFAFVRIVGTVLLGQARSDEARHAHECGWEMRLPMAALALLCLAGGVAPAPVATRLLPVARAILGPAAFDPSVTEALTPFPVLAILLLGGIALLGIPLALATRRAAADSTWGCGYASPTARMQYTGRSFAEISDRLVPSFLHARSEVSAPGSQNLFPAGARYRSFPADPFTRSWFRPLFEYCGDRFAALRWVQQGALPIYLLYILVVVLAAFTWTVLGKWMQT